jgi:cytochrome c oxidase subunit 2
LGLAFLLFLVAVTIAGVVLFSGHYWWFPPLVSTFTNYDVQFMRTLTVVAIVFVAVQLALGFAVFRFRNRGGKARHFEGNNKLEVVWTTATLVVLFTLGVLGQRMWAQLHFTEAPADAMVVEVTGQQFQWNFRYPGPDGVFGRTAPEFVNDSEQNYVGLDLKDPAGEDDITTANVMVVPVNKPVKVILHSKDVTHSFFLPGMRIKQDAVPGLTISIHFTPTTIGEYEIPCAELCGLGHYRMRGLLRVVMPENFDAELQKVAIQH